MNVREFVDNLGGRPPAPVILLGPGKPPFGKEDFEPFLVDRALEAMHKRYVDPSMEDLTFSAVYADETQPGEIAVEAETLPFLAERRVLFVRNAERYKVMSGGKGSALAPLMRYLENPLASTLLVFVASSVDRRKRFYKACAENGLVVECPQLGDNEMAAWIRKEVKHLGKRIDGDAAAELVRRAGGRLSDVHNAVSLVATYVGENNAEIAMADVVAACSNVAEETVWALNDAIATSRPKDALRILHQLFDLGTSHDEVMGTINWLLENAYRTCPESRLSVKSQFVREKVAPLARKLGFKKMKDAFALCEDTHFMMRSTGVDPTLALELMVIKLSAPRPQRKRPTPR